MKSAYELAMERLNKTSPTVKTSTAQKKALAKLDSKYAAKMAGRELALRDQISQAVASNEFEKAQQLEQQLVIERKKLQTELEEKKDAVRSDGGRK